MNTIELQRVTKTFRIEHVPERTVRSRFLAQVQATPWHHETLRALDCVSLTVSEGEFVGMIGPNGSGKSTVLRVMAGIYPPDEGTVTVTGRVMPLLELGVGFQPELSAYDNVFRTGVLLGLRYGEIQERLPEIIAFSGLERFMATKLAHFSTGMQMRLAFALAIQVSAPILLLDEFFSVGDEAFQAQCAQELTRFRTEGRTIVMASHDLEKIQQWCDRAVYLKGGAVADLGRPEEVVQHYRRDVHV